MSGRLSAPTPLPRRWLLFRDWSRPTGRGRRSVVVALKASFPSVKDICDVSDSSRTVNCFVLPVVSCLLYALFMKTSMRCCRCHWNQESTTTVKACSMAEYLDAIHHLSAGRRTIWYRGQTEAWGPQPRVFREFNRQYVAADLEGVHERERWYNNDFQHAASVFLETKPPLDDFSGWLTLMQHYGLPTRLLDWSRSALFALYFAIVNQAVLDHPKQHNQLPDGVIWLLDPFALNDYAHLEDHPYLYHMEHWTIRYVVYSAFRRGIHRDFWVNADEKARLKEWKRYQETVVACHATQCDRRVANQQSAFTVHSSLKPLEDIATEWLLRNPTSPPLLSKVVIPGEIKYLLLDDLYRSGITHSTVFPDLQHVALDIRRHYQYSD